MIESEGGIFFDSHQQSYILPKAVRRGEISSRDLNGPKPSHRGHVRFPVMTSQSGTGHHSVLDRSKFSLLIPEKTKKRASAKLYM